MEVTSKKADTAIHAAAAIATSVLVVTNADDVFEHLQHHSVFGISEETATCMAEPFVDHTKLTGSDQLGGKIGQEITHGATRIAVKADREVVSGGIAVVQVQRQSRDASFVSLSLEIGRQAVVHIENAVEVLFVSPNVLKRMAAEAFAAKRPAMAYEQDKTII